MTMRGMRSLWLVASVFISFALVDFLGMDITTNEFNFITGFLIIGLTFALYFGGHALYRRIDPEGYGCLIAILVLVLLGFLKVILSLNTNNSIAYFAPTKVATIAWTSPSWNAPTQVSQGGCIPWSDVSASMAGQKKCVFGYMVSQDQEEYGTYIRFSNSGNTFYFIDLYQEDNYFVYNIKPGDCVQGEGIVKEYQGIPRIEVTGLKNCN